jgi:CrcB protein
MIGIEIVAVESALNRRPDRTANDSYGDAVGLPQAPIFRSEEIQMIWFLVGLGGALGSLARHGLNHVIHQRNLSATFPIGIFVINVLGSALIGAVVGLVASGRVSLSFEARTFVIVGLLGGFTTFSSFSLDTLALIRDGHLESAVWNVIGQVGLSLIAVWAGYRVGGAI